MRFLRTNTAVRVTVGPFFASSDGITPKTALTVTNCKLTFMVDDGNVPTLVLDTNPTASGGANDMVHVTGDDAGFYDLELAAANVNYLGRAMLALTDATNHCPVFHEFMILPAMVYDSLVLGTDRLDTNVTHVADTAQTGRDIGASVLLSSGTGTGQLDFTSGVVKGNVTQFGGSAGTFASGVPSVNLSAAERQKDLRRIYQCSGTVWCVATIGDDTTGDGLTWDTAYATVHKACSVAVARDLVLIGPGTIDEVATRCAPVDGVSFKGAGMSFTKIIWSSGFPVGNGVMFRLPSNAFVEDLEIDAANQSYPVGFMATYQTPAVNCIINRVKITGSYDGLYLDNGLGPSGGVIDITLNDCEINTTYDCIALFGRYAVVGLGAHAEYPLTGKLRLNNTRLRSAAAGANPSRGIVTFEAGKEDGTAVVEFIMDGGLIFAQDGTTATNCLRIGSGSTAIIRGVDLRTSSAGSSVADLLTFDDSSTLGAGAIRATDCRGSGTNGVLTTSGTGVTTVVDVAGIATDAITAAALAGDSVAEIAAAVWADTLETGVTYQQGLQRIGAVVAGKISGAGTGTEIFVGLDGVSTRVTVTATAAGNRSNVVYA